LELYEEMQQEGVDPNPVTFVGILNACATVAALKKADALMNRSFELVWSLMNGFVVVSWTCTLNV